MEKNFENHDLSGLVALFTEDCVRMLQGSPAAADHTALEAAYGKISPKFGLPKGK